ncbi:hypothetical protein OKC48_20835 [Methylorubrum extorquens]|uniref:hypothetical protein n=1 Tax=Methylorubrum extorquens TaxID=408 RepID=UPI002237AABD|nr:hypothetical protein [Methylorubrum extorquens]UYW25694.1 hypothetical protein OKC48_20835 [Methylorubrum extorquens]
MTAPQMLISYDLTGEDDKKDEFLNQMIKAGWTDHIQRGPKFDRLPNTTLICNLSAEEAVRTFRTAQNKATRDGTGKFAVTHWTITHFTEVNGGVADLSETKAAGVLKEVPKDD